MESEMVSAKPFRVFNADRFNFETRNLFSIFTIFWSGLLIEFVVVFVLPVVF